MKKYIKLLCVVLLIFAIMIFACENAILSVDEYDTVFCAFGQVEDVIVCSGKITDINSSVIDVDHPAYFSEVYATEGDYVKTGDVIAKIDTVRTIELLQRIDNETIAELLVSMGISNALQIAITEDIPELSKYRDTVEKLINSDGIIRSPRDGIVTEMEFVKGELVMDATKAIVSNRDTMGVSATVAAEYIRHLSVGSSASITSDCFPETFDAVITKISPNTNSNGYVEIFLQLNGDCNSLKSGFPVTLRVSFNEDQNALLLPYECVFEEGDDVGFVYVRNGERVKKVTVKLGVRTMDYTQITSGLTGREEVILSMGNDLTDGQYIRFNKG